MAISFNHTIVAARDKRESAEFLAELFGLPSPKPFGHFMAVELEHGATLDYADAPEGEEIRRQHYAFLVSDDDFDAIYGKIADRGLQHWADPGRQRPGEINLRDGGRGVYFLDPSGHAMEILTRPYGSGG
ncbi:bleomycin resistance protein [Mycobacterium paraense]|uniref:Bleomycin resistance protein n=1 Tax=Mycobacterium paraense TaxID=767916 RepID=A0A1X2AFQ9_9MYCO|nr:VOC family protein [Mycobacterium paraense]ORW26704.1 bleomycin resistance protein [Mycobacterium paraense]ORW46341.1 bleomycin resistance protein [Mycobacterium paraense]ORW50146.1 bleomycin resistance protein [Mycobacterium paraense]